ncbi:MAG: dephospho-CoA kinase [Candidatus Omnitrophica bacterium]|nr:dephospho-CoA kinase [Candidatus Omnitrophota bacterium]MDD5771061.1 dephospho-CoA kinase [Candidatus Omnitrophota bacterium]
MQRRKKVKLILGITGTIGSGKSTVARMFETGDSLLIDADKLAHESFRTGSPVYKKIVAFFGEGILGRAKRIDRAKLARIVFVNRTALERLNKIVHKSVIADIRRMIRDSDKSLIILDAALILESKLKKMVDELLVVKAGKEQRILRSKERLGLSRREVLDRMKYQISQGAKLRLADFIIDNSGSMSKTRRQVSETMRKLGICG